MLPTIIGIIFLVFFALVVYWFLITVQKPVDSKEEYAWRELRYGLDFETAPEIMAYPSEHIAEGENNLKLIPVKDAWMACWAIQNGFLGEKQAEKPPVDADHDLVMRIYEAGDLLRHHDIKIDKLSGCCRLYLRNYRAYYVSLGYQRGKQFYPLLVSNTVMPNEMQ